MNGAQLHLAINHLPLAGVLFAVLVLFFGIIRSNLTVQRTGLALGIIAAVLSRATNRSLQYFSLLRPYSEARIAALFARESRFDHVFSSCNENLKLSGNSGPLWCGKCPKAFFSSP